MTSKEKLQKLRLSLYQPNVDVRIIEAQQKILDDIEADLEILEILKKHLFINSWGEIVYEPKHHYQYINGEECKLFKPNEEDIKIKEWLENDK